MEENLCTNFNEQASLGIVKLPRIRSRRDTPRPSLCIPYERPRIRKLSFADLWEQTFPGESSSDVGSPTSDESSESLEVHHRRNDSTTQPSVGVSPSSLLIDTRRTSEVGQESRSPKLGDARFGDLKPSENWTRMRSRSRSGSMSAKPWRPRSLSTISLPSVDDLKNTGCWSPTIQGPPSRRPSLSRSPGSWTPRRLSGVYSRRFSDSNHATDAAKDIARFREATNQRVDPTSTSTVSACDPKFKRYVVEVTGDPSGVANGTYHFTEKNSRKPFFTRHAPRKATLAPRQSHGMWFLLCWGEEKDGKPTWTDYCSPHDGELPPQKGWRKCSRTKDKLRWEFGDEVPIRVEVNKDAYSTYT